MRHFQRAGFLESAESPPSENLVFLCILRALIDKKAKIWVAEKVTVSLVPAVLESDPEPRQKNTVISASSVD